MMYQSTPRPSRKQQTLQNMAFENQNWKHPHQQVTKFIPIQKKQQKLMESPDYAIESGLWLFDISAAPNWFKQQVHKKQRKKQTKVKVSFWNMVYDFITTNQFAENIITFIICSDFLQ